MGSQRLKNICTVFFEKPLEGENSYGTYAS